MNIYLPDRKKEDKIPLLTAQKFYVYAVISTEVKTNNVSYFEQINENLNS